MAHVAERCRGSEVDGCKTKSRNFHLHIDHMSTISTLHRPVRDSIDLRKKQIALGICNFDSVNRNHGTNHIS